MVKVELSADKKQLLITADIETPVASKSGKTLVVASTRGNMKTNATINHNGVERTITLGLNAYIPA